MPTALAVILGAACKGALFVLLALALTRTLLRQRSAATRHAVWSAALTAHLMLLVAAPFVPAWTLPSWRLPAWRAAAPQMPAQLPPASEATGAAAEQRAEGARVPVAAPVAGDSSSPRVPVWAVLWILGVLAVAIRYSIGTMLVARLARTSERVEDGGWLAQMQRTANRMGISRPLTLMRGDRLGVPVTWGVIYPVVLLPREANEWPEARRHFVLVHEMAHVKRLDALTQIVAQVAETLFWFSPAVWYAGRQVRLERERACDDYVLRHGTSASFYADELLGMVRCIRARSTEALAPAFAALAMARPSEFEGRMLAILDPEADRGTLGSRGSLATIGAALALALPLAALQPFAAARDAEAAVIERGSVVSVPRAARRVAPAERPHEATIRGKDGRGAGDVQRHAGPEERRIDERGGEPATPRPVPRLTPIERRTLLDAIEGIAAVRSDGDKAALLQDAIPDFLTEDDALRAAFFRTVGTIRSSGDLAAVLLAVIPKARVTCEDAMIETLRASTGVSADGDRAAVLMAAARGGLLVSRATRAAYVESARTIRSDGDYRAVMELLLGS